MQLKSKISLLSFLLASFATNVNAGMLTDIYAGAFLGSGARSVFKNMDITTDPSIVYGAVFGLDVPILRVELEYNRMHSDNLKFDLGMINGYAKMPSTLVKPYFGIGLGATIDGKFESIDKSLSGKPAYQAMFGATFDFPVLPVKFDIELHGLYIPKFNDFLGVKYDSLSYDIRLKARYIF